MTLRPAVLALVAALGLASAAPAQYLPYGGFRPGYGMGYGPSMPNLPFNIPLGGGLNYNPVFGSGAQFYYGGVVPYGSNGVGPAGQLYVNPRSSYAPAYGYGGQSSFGGGTFGSASGAGQPVLGREQRDIQSAQNQATFRSMTGEAERNVGRWVASQPKDSAPADPLTAVDPALIHPTEDALVSGAVLNDLADRIAGLEGKNRKARPGLCPPELLEKITFAGGPAADLFNLFRRPAQPILPADLPADLDPEPLTHAYAAVAASLFAGRKAAPADVAKLRDAAGQLKAGLEPYNVRATIPEAGRWLAFFTALDAAARFAAEPAAAEALSAKWPSVGANVSDLVRQMAKAKVRFGRAAVGDELAYATLHRALLGHFAALTQAK